MTEPFRISYDWHPLPSPRWFDADGFADIDPLMLAFKRFSSSYDATVDVIVGEHVLPLDLEGDLPILVDELAPVLEALAGDVREPLEMAFPEQGSDFTLVVEPAGDTVSLRLRRGLQPGPRFDTIPDDLGSVDRSAFVAQWRQLAQDVIDELVRMEPGLDQDPSTREYRRRLARLGDEGSTRTRPINTVTPGLSRRTQYYKREDPDGTVSTLARLRESAAGLHGEAFVQGEWLESPGVMRYLGDPGAADPITEEEAGQIIRAWGQGTL